MKCKSKMNVRLNKMKSNSGNIVIKYCLNICLNECLCLMNYTFVNGLFDLKFLLLKYNFLHPMANHSFLIDR